MASRRTADDEGIELGLGASAVSSCSDASANDFCVRSRLDRDWSCGALVSEPEASEADD